MKKWPSYAVLAAAVAFLASVPAIRSCEQRKIENPEFHAVLYWGHLDAIDSETKEHISFEVAWDYEGRSPFIKGSAPSVVETLADGSKIIMIVGVYAEAPLRVSVRAPGYHSKAVNLTAILGGVLNQSQDQVKEIVALKRIGTSER